MERLIIAVAVGYMLKVVKNRLTITKYKKEFAAIRHGDYIDFINLVGGEIPFMVVYDAGDIRSGILPPNKDDIDFELLLKSAPSLKIFYNNCVIEYGIFQDNDLADLDFELLCQYEIGLRMHANNAHLLRGKTNFEEVIRKLSKHKGLSDTDQNILQDGRRFLNMVKHPKNQFPSYTGGVNALKEACRLADKHQLTIV
jgi:hypothetical protein